MSRCGDGIGSTTSLQALALGCQDLIELDLGWTGVEDQGVSVLLQSCKLLARLCLQGCKQLTVSTAEVLGSSYGNQLAWVDLSWVNAMDAQVIYYCFSSKNCTRGAFKESFVPYSRRRKLCVTCAIKGFIHLQSKLDLMRTDLIKFSIMLHRWSKRLWRGSHT